MESLIFNWIVIITVIGSAISYVVWLNTEQPKKEKEPDPDFDEWSCYVTNHDNWQITDDYNGDDIY